MKRISRILACIFAVLLSCQATFASAANSQSDFPEKADELAQEQYRTLMVSFGFEDSLTDIIYPDNYGGSYINDEGVFVVLTTSASNREVDIARYLSGTYIVDDANYSYNELLSMKNNIDDAMMHLQNNTSVYDSEDVLLLNSISSFYISQKDNSVVVGITDLSDDKINTFYDLFGESSAYIFTECMQTTTTVALKAGGSVSSPMGALSIGWPVYFYDDNNNVCKGFISAGHAFDVGDIATINGKKVGVCTDSCFSGRNDAAIIKITDPNYSMSNTVADSNVTLANTKYMLVAEGSTIYKVGDTSGFRSGTVLSRNGSVVYNTANGKVTISNVLITDAMNLGGDSGGVVYCKSGSAYYAIGSSSGSQFTGSALTESSFIQCYVW